MISFLPQYIETLPLRSALVTVVYSTNAGSDLAAVSSNTSVSESFSLSDYPSKYGNFRGPYVFSGSARRSLMGAGSSSSSGHLDESMFPSTPTGTSMVGAGAGAGSGSLKDPMILSRLRASDDSQRASPKGDPVLAGSDAIIQGYDVTAIATRRCVE